MIDDIITASAEPAPLSGSGVVCGSRVVLVDHYLPSYRVPVFSRLRDMLADEGVALDVVYGRPAGAQAQRGDATNGGGLGQCIRSFGPLHQRFPLTVRAIPPRLVRKADLIIGDLSAGAVESLVLAGATKRFATFGHAYRATSPYNIVDAAVEGWLMRRSRHVFTYTERGRVNAVLRGVLRERVTVVENTIDTRNLRREIEQLPSTAVDEARRQHGIDDGPVLTYLGGLDKPKRIGFVLRSMAGLRRRVPRMTFLVAGDGALRRDVLDFAERNSWARYVGRVDDTGKAMLARVSDLLVNPGRVGLLAVDSFAMGTPVATTDWPYHAPEFEYLSSRTALITRDSVSSFVDELYALLGDPERLSLMRAACLAESSRFSVERMARNFSRGIVAALEA